MGGTFEFEGASVVFEDGDTMASALYRHGVRTFTRSLKYHRRRGLYCGTGDCPNCLITVDGIPGVRSCVTPVQAGSRVRREAGWPKTELDLLSVTDRLHALMPVGFYYKTFIRPRFAWELAERVIRRATGLGALPKPKPPPGPVGSDVDARHVRCDVLVIGAGVAGLGAALEAARAGASVVLADEGTIGAAIAPGPTLERIRTLEAAARDAGARGIELLEGHAAIGAYEGPVVALVADDALVEVHPERVIVATGATEMHVLFPGNDLPGVWLGRGAARMAGVHHVSPGDRVVVAVGTPEGLEHAGTLRGAGAEVLVLVPEALEPAVPSGVHALVGAEIVRAEGRRHVTGVVVREGARERRIPCDALVMALDLSPRDGVLRMAAAGEPFVGAGDVVMPGCSLEEAEASGRRVAGGDPDDGAANDGTRPAGVTAGAPPPGSMVCLCEDVSIDDLDRAWREGFTSSEILKRYTTATMGPCQGAMCGRHLAAFSARRAPDADRSRAGVRTASRPPARPAMLETLAASVHEVIEQRTSLHDLHLEMGATLGWSGSWTRPFTYGDAAEEYRAVRERVGMMDVGTLGKFLVAGPDASALIDAVFPCRIDDLEPGRSRYALALDEAGYVFDDGMLCAVGDGAWYVTTTSGGAARMDAHLRNWADRLDLRVHVLDQTSQLGAIVVAGPSARDLVGGLSEDDLGIDVLPTRAHREITVAGVACRALRVGFVGEVAYELHHPRSAGPTLWRALLRAGADFDLRPHGLDALEVLRLEKGHVYLGQDTLPDDTPAKLGSSWAIAMDKGRFVGQMALQRMSSLPMDRKLVGLRFDGVPGAVADLRGVPLTVDDRVVGRITSAERSPAVGADIGLGWIRAVDGEFPTSLGADGVVSASVVATPFYDPAGERLRG
jgi:sarcosine oxidase subunit alpha